MVNIAFALLLLIQPIQGRASQYAPGVMEGTIRVRQSGRTEYTLPQEIPEVDGFVTTRECEDIGSFMLLRLEGTEKWELFWIVDCASKSDHQSDTDPRSGYQWMIDNGIIVEIGHETAHRWGVVGILPNVEAIQYLPQDIMVEMYNQGG